MKRVSVTLSIAMAVFMAIAVCMFTLANAEEPAPTSQGQADPMAQATETLLMQNMTSYRNNLAQVFALQHQVGTLNQQLMAAQKVNQTLQQRLDALQSAKAPEHSEPAPTQGK